MRHGPAEEAAESGIDGDRALTASGRERVRKVAKALLDAGEEPLNIFTSPLVRAAQTAEIVAIVTNLDGRTGTVSARREIAPGASALGLVRRWASERRRRVMLVGHEPDLSGLVAGLLGTAMGQPFEKAMVVALHIPPDAAPGRLRFLLEPKTLHLGWATGGSPE
jgi:phosphohistidine phosphatase